MSFVISRARAQSLAMLHNANARRDDLTRYRAVPYADSRLDPSKDLHIVVRECRATAAHAWHSAGAVYPD